MDEKIRNTITKAKNDKIEMKKLFECWHINIFLNFFLIFFSILIFTNCNNVPKEKGKANNDRVTISAKEILGNPKYQAISYGGYRKISRDIQPTIAELKEDFKILAAMDIKLLRTYNTHFAQAANILKAIHELKQEDASFEMYVMLGVWINCQGAFTANINHNEEDEKANQSEIARAVALAKQYPEIVKIIAGGNEAMVKWAASYFVQPGIILKWVNYLQALKKDGTLSKDLWITSSDNYVSWGGGDSLYHVKDLEQLIQAVDFVSLHTYPMHDTHYNPAFWGVLAIEQGLSKIEKINKSMQRALKRAQQQYNNTKSYIHTIDKNKPVHIGETGWASLSNKLYGDNGSKATDEYKEALYYKAIRNWTNANGISCFYFEAFDEIWKDAANPGGSENHFGLFDINGQAKYALWDLVDQNKFQGLKRGSYEIEKTFDGNLDALMEKVKLPPNAVE